MDPASGEGGRRRSERFLLAPAVVGSSASENRTRLLLVEDDYELRTVLSEVLEDEGYRVDAVGNGKEALDYLESGQRPCLVLLDLMMPVMSGWEFRNEQVRRAHLSDIPVVILTADGGADTKAEMLGADGFLRKPIEIERLLGVIRRYGC